MQSDGDRTPFGDLRVDDWSFLDASGRSKCEKCGRSRRYYCYTCCVPLPHLAKKLPRVKLPLKVDIIKSPKELDGKSTAPHASILAPDDVTIHTYPCVPDYDSQKVIVVFPAEDSVTLDKLFESSKELIVIDSVNGKQTTEVNEANSNSNTLKESSTIPDSTKNHLNNGINLNAFSTKPQLETDSSTSSVKLPEIKDKPVQCDNEIDTSGKKPVQCDNEIDTSGSINTPRKRRSTQEGDIIDSAKQRKRTLREIPFERVVFIDCTWNQTKQIADDERLKDLRKVVLTSQTGHFWRSQAGVPKTYLSTIEAIYYFLKDFHSLFLDSAYDHQYDNLLLFFCLMYNKINQTNSTP